MSVSHRDLSASSVALAGAVVSPQSETETDRLPAPSPELHLLKRVTFGPRPGDLEYVERLGLRDYLDEQLHPARIDDSEMDAMLAPYAMLTMSPAQLLAATPGQVSSELVTAAILRAIYSRRQLYEVMVDFWTNHFNIHIGKGLCRQLKTADDRDVIRQHALGRFSDLLMASAKSPAMLFYLDNTRNNKSAPNENYAREIMELHTLGVNGGYSEQDITEVARCFTGWTVSGQGEGKGEFRFVRASHDDGRKVVLGTVIAARGGIKDGEQVVALLARHPSTAAHIATKLCRRFVSDDPPAALVQRVAQAFTANNGDIAATLRVLLTAPAFAGAADSKIRRPFELLTAAVRILDARPADAVTPEKRAATLARLLQGMGQQVFGWAPPDGYPDVAPAWINTSLLLARWNAAITLAENRIPEARYDAQALVPRPARSAGAIVTALADRIVQRRLNPADHAALATYLAPAGPETVPDARTLARRLPELVGLLLNSPYFQRR